MIDILHDTISTKAVLRGTQLIKNYNKYGKNYKVVTETLKETRCDLFKKKLTKKPDKDCTAIITKILDKGNNELVVRIRNIQQGYQGDFYIYKIQQLTLRNSQTSKKSYLEQSWLHRVCQLKKGKIVQIGQYKASVINFDLIRSYLYGHPPYSPCSLQSFHSL